MVLGWIHATPICRIDRSKQNAFSDITDDDDGGGCDAGHRRMRRRLTVAKPGTSVPDC